MTARNATAEWRGDSETGSGTITVGDGVFEGQYSAQTRFGDEPGTNPEQLIAAGLASCYTMALAHLLSTAGHPPESLHTAARVRMRFVEGAPSLSQIDVATEGRVLAIDQDQFRDYAEQAKVQCPVSRALAGIPEITLTARLLAGDKT
jgi:osmotically inducible protein OsmC